MAFCKGAFMKYHHCTSEFVCGVDLHSRMMFICIIDRSENILVHKKISNNDLAGFKKTLQPYIGNISVSAESTFAYYFLSDFCEEINVPFLLGNALYMKHIHGGKTKNDKIDSLKIAELTMKNYLPFAHICSKGVRHVRGLLRCRNNYVQYRTGLIAQVKIQLYQANLPSVSEITEEQIREDFISQKFLDENQRFHVESNLETISFYNKQIRQFEKKIIQQTKSIDDKRFKLLMNIRGFGIIISSTILLEIDDINRFPSSKDFLSYCRLVKCSHESAGKKLGFGNNKIGNPYLRYIFGEAAIQLLRNNPEVKEYLASLISRKGKAKALSALARKTARSVFYILKKEQPFNLKMLLHNS